MSVRSYLPSDAGFLSGFSFSAPVRVVGDDPDPYRRRLALSVGGVARPWGGSYEGEVPFTRADPPEEAPWADARRAEWRRAGAAAALVLPEALDGRARDLWIRVDAASDAPPLSADGVSFRPAAPDLAADPLVRLTETAPGEFLVRPAHGTLSGRRFDFSAVSGLYEAVRGLVEALGGAVDGWPVVGG